MKAMILAAGLGTRLRPLTNDKPKALVEVCGKPLIEHVILKLKLSGVKHVVINLHHFGDQIKNFVETKNNFGLKIDFSDESEALLSTGGGIKKAANFLKGDEPFFVYNTDVLSDIDLGEMCRGHLTTNALVTLAVRQRKTSRYFLFDAEGRLIGWESVRQKKRIIVGELFAAPERLSFMGVHLISPRIFDLLTEDGAFSIVDAYLRLAKEGGFIQGFRADRFKWLDLGRMENLEQAEKLFG